MTTITREKIHILRKYHEFEAIERLRKSKGAIGLFVVLIILCVSFIGPSFCKYGINQMEIADRFLAPCKEHWFGTDGYGRDVFVRTLYGAKYSIFIGVYGACASLLMGTVLGVLDGYLGGWFDQIFMRVIDIWSAIPGTLLAILISVILGSGMVNTIIALSIGNVPAIIRLYRSKILSIQEEDYLRAAISINASPARIMFRHIFPNTFTPALVATTMNIGSVITSAAALSYLGLGLPPTIPEWGAMLSYGKIYVSSYPWLVVVPGIAIGIVVVSVNLFGDGLRDAIDPRMKI